jgi:hypothetical protein
LKTDCTSLEHSQLISRVFLPLVNQQKEEK